MDNEIGKAIHAAIEQADMCPEIAAANHAAVDKEIADRKRQIKDRQAKARNKQKRAALLQRIKSASPKVEPREPSRS